MTCCCRETTLDELLADPLVKAVMKADGVDRRQLDAMLREIAGRRQYERQGMMNAGFRSAP